MDNEAREKARAQAERLQAAGHAAHYSEALEGTKVVGYVFTHYLSCRECEREKEKQHGEEREVEHAPR